MQHDRDQLDAVALGRSRQTVPCSGGVAGFQAGRTLVEADEFVGVRQTEAAAAHGVHPDRRVLFDRLVLQKLTGDHGQIVRRGQVLRGVCRVVQPGAVDKMRVRQAELGGALVHPLDKGRLAAGNVLRQRRGAVIGRADDHGLEHFVHAHLFARLQIDLAASLARRGVGGDDHVVPADAAGVQRLHHQKQGHDLRHRRRAQPFVRVFLIEHRAGRRVDQNGGRRRNLRSGRRYGGQADEQQRQRQQPGKASFPHNISPSIVCGTSVCSGAARYAGFCGRWLCERCTNFER